MNTAPDQARELLDGATTGPWTMHRYVPEDYIRVTGKDLKNIADNGIVEDGDARLIAAAPDLAQTIAGMEWQWGLERDYRCGTETDTVWFPSEDEAREDLSNPHRQHGNPRLVRRLVGPVEVINGE